MTSEKVVSRGKEVSRGIPDLCLVSSNTRLTRETLQSKAELCNKLPFTLRVVTLSLARENASSLRTFEEILSYFNPVAYKKESGSRFDSDKDSPLPH